MDLEFAVLNLVDAEHTAGREGWATIKCASKRAYGCGKGGNSAVQDFDLLVHHGDLENLSSSLSVRAGDKVFRWIDKVIAEKGGMRRMVKGDKDLKFWSSVEIVDKGLIVLTLSFSQYGGFEYYLVFDSVGSSLSMIPYKPHRETCYTRCPLPLRRDDGGYTLVLFVCESGFGVECENMFLWQWSPSWGGLSASDPWQTRKLHFPAEMKDKFLSPDVLFSSDGSAFWTDLALGTLCCDCSALLMDMDSHVVDFTFIELPPGYQVNRYDQHTWSVQLYRSMDGVGGYLRFASIDKPENLYDGRGARVKVWTLSPSRREWKLYSDLRLRRLFKDVKFKEAGLPRTLPMCPMLREHEAATLYFILAEEIQTRDSNGGRKHYLCRFDMPTKSLLQSKLLSHTLLVQGPMILLPSGLFEDLLDPLPESVS